MTADSEVRKLLGALAGDFALQPGLRAKESLRQINEWFTQFPALSAPCPCAGDGFWGRFAARLMKERNLLREENERLRSQLANLEKK